MDEQPTTGHDRGLTLPALRFAWFTAIALIPLFVFAMVINPLFGAALTVVLLFLFSACLLPTPACRRVIAGGLAVLAVITVLGGGWFYTHTRGYGPAVFDAQTRSNILTLQRSLERYSTDFGSYPVLFDALKDQGYRHNFANPYSETGAESDPMRNIDFHEARCSGNFTYLPDLALDEDGQLIATGYTMLLYGLSDRFFCNFEDHLDDGNPLGHVIYASTDEDFRQGEDR